METRSFFRWMPTAIILWTFGVMFAFAAAVCVFQVVQISQRAAMIGDAQRTVHWLLRGGITNSLIAACCILGWYLMSRRLPDSFALGAIVVTIGAFISA
jgi:hypothetical protein